MSYEDIRKLAAGADPQDGKVRIVFEFDTVRDAKSFLGWFSDGGGEDSAMESMDEPHDEEGRPETWVYFDYAGAFEAWGWNGQGDRTVVATRRVDEDDTGNDMGRLGDENDQD